MLSSTRFATEPEISHLDFVDTPFPLSVKA